MTATRRYGERRMTAFMENQNNMDQSNIMHANDGAKQYGYRAALIPGVTLYGWSVPAMIGALGNEWATHGWADLAYRRPTYPEDELVIEALERDDGVCDVKITNNRDEVPVTGEAGLGDAPWRSDLTVPTRLQAEPQPSERPWLLLEIAPVGQDLRPRAVTVSEEEARDLALRRQRDDNPLWSGEHPLVHPGWFPAQMTPLLHHSYDFGPAIAVRSQVQYLAPLRAGHTATIAGHCRDAYDRKGHHYTVTDGLILDEDGTWLAQTRHTHIFQPAKRGEGAA